MNIETEKARILQALKDVSAGLRVWNPNISDPRVETGDDDDTWTVLWGPGGIDIGWVGKSKTIGGEREYTGFRAFGMRYSAATRWEPEDAWDVTILESPSSFACVKALAMEQINHLLGEYVLSKAYPPYEDESQLESL